VLPAIIVNLMQSVLTIQYYYNYNTHMTA